MRMRTTSVGAVQAAVQAHGRSGDAAKHRTTTRCACSAARRCAGSTAQLRVRTQVHGDATRLCCEHGDAASSSAGTRQLRRTRTLLFEALLRDREAGENEAMAYMGYPGRSVLPKKPWHERSGLEEAVVCVAAKNEREKRNRQDSR
uniref:Uncharacterized protein n=2 Tax=Zea mays TaxID=4577 RepID=A0A804PS91_MAIZE